MVFSKVKYRLLKQMVLGISIREDGDVIKGLLIENNKGNVSTAEYLGSMDAIREFILAHPHIPVVISLDYSAILWQVLEAPIQNTDEAEKAFEELDYEECTEDQCIMLIQEMLQVENVFHLQIIVEGKDSQLSLSYRNLYEKMKVTDVCLGCGTF